MHTNKHSKQKKIPKSTLIVLVGVYCDEPSAKMDTLWRRNSSILSHITIRQWTKYAQTWAKFLRMTVFTVEPKPSKTGPVTCYRVNEERALTHSIIFCFLNNKNLLYR